MKRSDFYEAAKCVFCVYDIVTVQNFFPPSKTRGHGHQSYSRSRGVNATSIPAVRTTILANQGIGGGGEVGGGMSYPNSLYWTFDLIYIQQRASNGLPSFRFAGSSNMTEIRHLRYNDII